MDTDNYTKSDDKQLFMAKLANYSYAYAPTFNVGKKIFKEQPHQDWYYFQPDNISEEIKPSVFCAVNDIKKEVVIVFKGSEPSPFDIPKFISDWCVSDIRMLIGRVPLNFSEFVDYTSKIKNQFSEYKYYMTGHSLGGSVAQLIAAIDCNKDIETYTFNAFGAECLIKDIEKLGFLINPQPENIKNFVVDIDLVSEYNPHIGKVYTIKYKKSFIKSIFSIISETPKIFANFSYKLKNSIKAYLSFINLFMKKTDAHLMNNFIDGFEYIDSETQD